jgi:hypothetical protein
LADRALKFAGAESNDGGGDEVNYRWGVPVGRHQVIPGDILQLRDHVATLVTVTQVTFDDGSWYKNEERVAYRRPHHTAIVAAYKSPDSIVVFEQHVKPKGKVVQQHTIVIENTVPVVKTESASKKHANGKMQRATIVTTTHTEVSGQIWAYRPKPKKN